MSREISPKVTTIAPIGGLVALKGIDYDDIGWFGDDDVKLAVDHHGRPTVFDSSEQVLSRWVAEHSSSATFEIMGTWISSNGRPQQGNLATGAAPDNWLLLTESHLRGTIPAFKSKLQTGNGVMDIPTSHVYAFEIPLADITILDGNKYDISVSADFGGIVAKWVRAADASWTKEKSLNPWRRDNTRFATAVLAATIAAKCAHPDERVRASGAAVQDTDRASAFASSRRTTFEFSASA